MTKILLGGASLVVALLLSGCVSHTRIGFNQLKAGNLTAAENHFNLAIQEGDIMAFNNMGVVYERRGQLERAKAAYTLAARYGISIAQMNLMRLGEPVPPIDLFVAQAPAGPSGWEILLLGAAAGVTGYQDGKNAALQQIPVKPAWTPPPPPVKCIGKYNAFSKQTETVCQ